MLTASAVEEFVLSGTQSLEVLEESHKDPWKRLWGSPSVAKVAVTESPSLQSNASVPRSSSPFSLSQDATSASAEFSSDSEREPAGTTQPAPERVSVTNLHLEASALPWCNGQAFGLLINAFIKCEVDFQLRKHLLHCLLFALVRFPRQYLRHQESDALWFYQPVMVVATKYHLDLDTPMQTSYLACTYGLVTYALKKLGDDQRMTLSSHAQLKEALVFDLRCLVKLLAPPESEVPLTAAHDGCGKWFSEGYERVLATILRLQQDANVGVFEALRSAGICEWVARLLKSRFGWGSPSFISTIISVLYRQCKRDKPSVRHLLDSCHELLIDLYALLVHVSASSFPHFRAVTSLLQLLCLDHDVIGNLLAVSELVPVGIHPDDAARKLSVLIPCPHCDVMPAVDKKRVSTADQTPECPDVVVSADVCSHRQHPHIECVTPSPVVLSPGTPLKIAQLRRRIFLALIKIFRRSAPATLEYFISKEAKGFSRVADACERDAVLAAAELAKLVEMRPCKEGHFFGLQDGTSETEAVEASTREFERSESGLASGPEGNELLWYLVGNLLTYMSAASVAATAGGVEGNTSFERSAVGDRLAKSFRLLNDPKLPGLKILLSLGLLRLATHSSNLPLPENVCTPSLLKHHRLPVSIDPGSTGSDEMRIWAIYHPSVLSAALSMTVPTSVELPEAYWNVSSLLHRHILDVTRKITSVTIHNAYELHQSGFLRNVLAESLPLIEQRRDDDLAASIFALARCIGETQCATEAAKLLLTYINHEHIGAQCMEVFRHWASRDTPSDMGPHHFMSFPKYKDEHTNVVPVVALPKLSIRTWPCPGRGYTFAMWVRFETRDLAESGESTATIQSGFSHDENGACLVTDFCLRCGGSGSAELEFRVSMTDDSADTQHQYYHVTPAGLTRLKPQKWYHVCITHTIDSQADGINHMFDIRVNGGMREGTAAAARLTIRPDRREKFKKFSKRGGKLTCMLLGGSLMDVLFGASKQAPVSGNTGGVSLGGKDGSVVQKLLNLMREDRLEVVSQRACQRGPRFASLQLGSLLTFWGSITEWQSHLLYSMGRNYCGDLQEPLQSYHCHGVLTNRQSEVCSSPNPATRKSAAEWLSAAVGLAEGIPPQRTGDLHERLIMVISSRSSMCPFVSSKAIFPEKASRSNGHYQRSGGSSRQSMAGSVVGVSASGASTPRVQSHSTHSNTVSLAATSAMLSATAAASTASIPTTNADGTTSYESARASDDEDEFSYATRGESPVSNAGPSPSSAPSVSDTDTRRKTPANSVVVKASVDDRLAPYAAVSLSLFGSAQSMSSTTFKGILKAVGGMQSIVSLISLATTHAARVQALRLIVDLMAYSAENTQDMLANGYLPLAWYLQKNRVDIDEAMLEACFQLAGIDLSRSFDCVLHDINVVRVILLDWGIWSRAPLKVQRALIVGLSGLISSHPLGRAHRRMLIHAGIVPWILKNVKHYKIAGSAHHQMKNPFFSTELRGVTLQLLNALFGGTLRVGKQPGALPMGNVAPSSSSAATNARERLGAPPGESLVSLLRLFIETWNYQRQRPIGDAEAEAQLLKQNKWRRGLLELWVLLLSRCSARELVPILGNVTDMDTFVSLISDTCSRSRFSLMLSLSVTLKFTQLRRVFLPNGPNLVVHLYAELQGKRKSFTSVSPQALDSFDPALPEILLLLLLLTRGAAGPERGTGEPPVRQPLLALLFLKNFGGFITPDLGEVDLKILQRTVKEVLPVSGAQPEMPSETSLAHAFPLSLESCFRDELMEDEARETAHSIYKTLHEKTSLLQKLVADGDLPSDYPSIVPSDGSGSPNPRHSLTEKPRYAELAMPELLAPMLSMTVESLSPGSIRMNESIAASQKDGDSDAATTAYPGSPLYTANLKFKRALIVDALRQIFNSGSASVKNKFIEKQIPTLVVSLLCPQATCDDSGFAWLTTTLLCDMVSWAAAETHAIAGESPIVLLRNVLGMIADLSGKVRDIADSATAHSWVCHLQQHVLHACLLSFRKRLLGPETSGAVLASFVAFAELCTDLLQEWRFTKVTGQADSAPQEAHAPPSDGSQDAATSPKTPQYLPLYLEQAEEKVEHFHLNLLYSLNPSLEHTRLLCAPDGEGRATRGRSNAVKGGSPNLVWLIPAAAPTRPSPEHLLAYEWMKEEMNGAPDGAPLKSPRGGVKGHSHNRARSAQVHQLLHPEKSQAGKAKVAEPADEQGLSELAGAPSSVKSFIFWLFETVRVAVVFATSLQNNRSTPLKTKVLRTAGLGSQTPDAVLHKHMKRLLIEMLAFPAYCTRHALMPSNESASAFALVFLLRSVQDDNRADPLNFNHEVAQLWTPVAPKLHADNLLVVLTNTSRGDDETLFSQQLINHTSWRLRSARGDELTRLQAVWRYLVETKQPLIREAMALQALERRAHLPGTCVLFTLLMGPDTHSLEQQWTKVPEPRNDPLLHSDFLQKMRAEDAKSLKKIRRRRDERLGAVRVLKIDKKKSELTLYSTGKAQLTRLRKDHEVNAAASLKQERAREKESRGVIGKLVHSRVMLQDLWGSASAVYTNIVPEYNWRLDDVEGPDRMRLRMKRFLSKPLSKELGLISTGDSNTNTPHGSPAVPPSSPPGAFDDDDDELRALIDHKFEPGMHGHSDDGGVFSSFVARDKKLASYPCAQVTPMVRVTGELVLYSKALYFLSNDTPYKDDLEQNLEHDPLSQSISTLPWGVLDSSLAHDSSFKSSMNDLQKHRKKKMIQRMHLNAVRHRLTAQYAEISGVFRRKYLLMNNSLEVFSEKGLAFFFSFEDEREREKVYNELLSHCSRAKEMSHTAEKLTTWQEKWQRGEITNFQYIMSLNTIAGRSFNDLTQYPVFPHVLADYTSEELDLSDPNSYRDLKRPMGCQTEERRKRAADKYEQTEEMFEMERGDTARDSRKAFSTTQTGLRALFGKKEQDNHHENLDLYALPPYHHGSHFSNRATVLYYCIRLQPFTDYFCELNDLKLDVPDRSFHSMERAWRLSSAVSSSDVKELTPEFFYLPEFLVNNNEIQFGVKQDKIVVNHLELPPWAKGNPRIFVDMQRRALEGEECSKNLHHWIDLTFGYKASKEFAVEALNCFHPYAYEGAVNIAAIEDPVRRQSTIDIINNFGQMPTQLLTKPHKKRSVEMIFHAKDVPFWKTRPPERKIHEAPFGSAGSAADKALTLVKSEQRKEAIFTLVSNRVEGSSKESATTRCIDSVATETADDDICALGANQILLIHSSHEPGGELIGLSEKLLRESLQFRTWDNALKIRLYDPSRPGKEVLTLRQSTRVDPIRTAATSSTDSTHIALGMESGAIEIYKYGCTVPAVQRKATTLEAWEVEGDKDASFQFNTPQHSGEYGVHPVVPAGCLSMEDGEGRLRTVKPLAVLHGHTLAVVAIVVSKEYNVILSCGLDGLLIVWDLLDLTFIRSLSSIEKDVFPTHSTWSHIKADPKPNETISAVDINKENGDIVAISTVSGRTQLNVWNINGVPLGRKKLEEQATCIQFSGTLLLVGMLSGKVLCLETTTLTPVCTPLCPKLDYPVTALTTNEAQTKLFVAQSVPLFNMRTLLTTWSAKQTK